MTRGVLLAALPLPCAARAGVRPDQQLNSAPDATIPNQFPIFLKLKKSGSATVKRALFGKICGRATWFWKGRCGEYQGERTPLIYGVGGAAALATCLGDKSQAAEGVDRGWHVHVSNRTIQIPYTPPLVPIRVFVLVREPVARAASAFYFFGATRADALKRIPPARISVANLSEGIQCRWQGCRVHGNLQPSPLAVLSQTWDRPGTVADALERAAANIRNDRVVVGTFDRLETFLRVAVLEIGGVLPELVCAGHVYGDARDRTGRALRAWPPSAHAFLADKLAGDVALYALVDRAFSERVAMWGAAVASTRLCLRPVRAACANAPAPG